MGPEIDLFRKLKEKFPDDRIKRVDKGVPGADVITYGDPQKQRMRHHHLRFQEP